MMNNINDYKLRLKLSIHRIKLTKKIEELLEKEAFNEHENKITSLEFRKGLKEHLFKETQTTGSEKPFKLNLLEENLATLHFCLLFLRYSQTSEIFIKKIDQLIASGIIQRFEEKMNSADQLREKEEIYEPQQLTLDHLGIGFVTVAIFLGLSCFVFLLECVANWITKHLLRRLV
jgi:hypothetical protein